MWCRTVSTSDLSRQEWNLYVNYLENNQFPDDGYRLLVVDTSKRPRSVELLCHAWDYYCHHQNNKSSQHPIHVLVLCRREKQRHVSSLNDLSVGVSVFYNRSVPIAEGVVDALTGIFFGEP